MMRDHHLREHHILGVVPGGGRSACTHAVAAHLVPVHVIRSLVAAATGGERECGDRDDEQGVSTFHASSILSVFRRADRGVGARTSPDACYSRSTESWKIEGDGGGRPE